MTRERAVQTVVAKVWRVLVRLVRQGLIRQAVILTMFATVVVGLIHQDYDLATLALVWVIYLEITDPRRPSRVIVLRQKRKASPAWTPRRHPATLPARAQPSTPERSRYGSCRECGAPEMEWCRDGCSLVDRWDQR